eukprot:CAMPEP_0172449932 /NCGR_PEP_ID=MMETSP1065-20121228/8502_1 /TAXON_ID=265537 /ORGANISM="Amphiprora paludosa, Strain CCMP125" /LENGTH=394 /DNA_ID=CAMNT_0013201693 /DNA_START=99 /DNA_END=1283 /DNA_ORIENTATION=+
MPLDKNEMIHALARLLSVRKGSDTMVSGVSTQPVKQCGLDSALECNDRIEFSSPALSLAHDDHLEFNHESRNEAERSAFMLLSRPIGFVLNKEGSGADGGIGDCSIKKVSEVGELLLLNVSESFALLVDSRLRAHATFLAKHGLTAPSGKSLLDQKLGTLLELGNRVAVSSIETGVEVVDLDQLSDDQPRSSAAAVSFRALLKLCLESLDGSPRSSLPVRFEVSGSLSIVSQDSPDHSMNLKMQLDTKELLAQMKLQAADIVAHVVDITNTFFAVPEDSSIGRGDSFLAMPPPPKLESNAISQAQYPRKNFEDKRELPGDSKTLALISPDLSATSACTHIIPTLMLDDQGMLEFDLSPDQCANILDDVFGNVDLTLFASSSDEEPPQKKTKISG